MAVSVLYMSMSLDGYIAGPHDNPDNPGGDGGAVERLHAWGQTEDGSTRTSGPGGAMIAAILATGAVLVGRRTAEQVDHWDGDHHDGVPIFVVSHRPPGPSAATYPSVTYLDGIEDAMEQAKAAAGDREVLVHGAYTARRALAAGVLDELQFHLVPVLLGGGLRQFELLPSRVELDIVRVIDTPEATHLRYRVRRE
jgi:dihydrofolate reductase